MSQKAEISGGVYGIKNKLNGMIYIGATSFFIDRWANHKASLHHSSRLQNDRNKFGENVFTFDILEKALDDTDISILERQWLNKYPTKILYNTKHYYQSTSQRIVKWVVKHPRYQTPYYLPESVDMEVKVRAARDRVKPSDVVRTALESYLGLDKDKKSKK